MNWKGLQRCTVAMFRHLGLIVRLVRFNENDNTAAFRELKCYHLGCEHSNKGVFTDFLLGEVYVFTQFRQHFANDLGLGLLQFCSRSAARQLDRNITFHKLVAYMIAFHTGQYSVYLSRLQIKLLLLLLLNYNKWYLDFFATQQESYMLLSTTFS